MILEALISARAATPRQQVGPDGGGYFDRLLNFIDPARRTVSGVRVSDDLAWNCSCFYCGVATISEAFASTPLHLYRRGSGDDDRERATDHPLYDLIHGSPNDEQTAFTFFQNALGHNLGWGNAYADIERDSLRRVVALWPIAPDRVRPRRVQAGEKIRVIGWDRRLYTPPAERIVYEVKTDDTRAPVLIDRDRLLHVPGLGFDGVRGFGVLRVARELLGTSIAAEQFTAAFFGNGAIPAGFLKPVGEMSPEQMERIVASLEKRHGGADKRWRLGVLPFPLEFEKLTVDPEEASLLGVRRFTTEEWARYFKTPIHFFKDLSNAGTRANVTTETLSFATDTMRPWFKRWEQELRRKLLSADERRDYYFEALWESIVQYDLLTRMKAYWQASQGGWMSVNDIRRRDNMNAIGPQGEMYRWPANAYPADRVASGEFPPKGKRQRERGEGGQDNAKAQAPIPAVERVAKAAPRRLTTEQRVALVDAHLPAFEDAYGRLCAKEEKSLGRLAKKRGDDHDGLRNDINAFYADHEPHAAAVIMPLIGPVLATVRAAVGPVATESSWLTSLFAERMAKRHCFWRNNWAVCTFIPPLRFKQYTAGAIARYELDRMHNGAVFTIARDNGWRTEWHWCEACVGRHEPDAPPPVTEDCRCQLDVLDAEPLPGGHAVFDAADEIERVEHKDEPGNLADDA
ncbi:MAG: phage portal protein [Candidatus Nanopelagicales bacterium]|nr:phage portal protein [Candidatus Nanopelagicales bacterium]